VTGRTKRNTSRRAMKLSNTANVIYVEHDNGRLIEIGVTTLSIKEREILHSYSLPIKPDFQLSSEIDLSQV